ncbi:MAG: thiamine pyrophosphate-dependent enzyme [Methanimicrococcus sp.]|nr:thiamine pyrophosphate-dependent enzyme [Methanimicrococcus sp.]
MKSPLNLSGIEALILSAADNHVSAVFGVPGSPMTAVTESFMKSPRFSESSSWFSNEKIAFEWALGFSFSGKRSLVVVKHVGVNALSDALMTATVHGIGAGLVILAGDDPSLSGSQNSQDTRFFGSLAGTAVFDPATPDELFHFLGQAFLLSEKTKAPILIRVTESVLNQTQTFVPPSPNPCEPARYDRSNWAYRMKGRYLRFHLLNDELFQKAAEENCVSVSCRFDESDADKKESESVGIISSGFCAHLAESALSSSTPRFSFSGKTVSLLKLGVVSPLPISKIRSFLKNHSRVLVIEESEPFIEDQIRVFGNVLGKRTKHLPFGNVSASDIVFSLENIFSDSVVWGSVVSDKVISDCVQNNIERAVESLRRLPDAPSYFCSGCVYEPFFEMLSVIKEEKNLSVTGDIGCSMYGAVPPYSVSDSAVSLGSGIGIGSGANAARSEKTVIVSGDFGFFHFGLLSLTEAIEKKSSVLIYVMQNSAAGMTGGQNVSNPENIIRGMLFSNEESAALNSLNVFPIPPDFSKSVFEDLASLSRKELKREGISVILIQWICQKKK